MSAIKFQTWHRSKKNKRTAQDLATCESCERKGKPAHVLASVFIDRNLRPVRKRLCRFCRVREGFYPEDYERSGRTSIQYEVAA